jgi:tetratricopeptide (TPR) repeat protein
MAAEYGLDRAKIGSFDADLAGRLLRFGKVAQTRGRHEVAKRFFWQALLVDPTSKLAWLYYDQAVLMTLAGKVERLPGLVGLEGLSREPGAALPEPPEPKAEEGC